MPIRNLLAVSLSVSAASRSGGEAIVGHEQIEEAHALGCNLRAIQMLRSRVIKALISGCVEIYASIADKLDEGRLEPGNYGSGIVGQSRHAKAVDEIRSFSKAEIYRLENTQALRRSHATTMKSALGGLVGDLLDVLDQGGQVETARHPFLSRLAPLRLDAKVPSEPDMALPWLMDQVTLLSDRQILDMGNLARE